MRVILFAFLFSVTTSVAVSAQNKQIYTNQQARNQIDSLYARLQNGADFEELARRYSQDVGSSQRGGDVGWAKPGTFVEPYELAARSLQINQFTKAFQSEFGYHIVQLTDRKGELIRTRHIIIRVSR